MTADDAVTREQLVQARADLQRQIETLQTPARSYDAILNAGMIDRLRSILAEVNEQLANCDAPRTVT